MMQYASLKYVYHVLCNILSDEYNQNKSSALKASYLRYLHVIIINYIDRLLFLL